MRDDLFVKLVVAGADISELMLLGLMAPARAVVLMGNKFPAE
jgi:hypothetical protein